MKKYYCTIASILFFGLLSCSNEDTKTQNQVASRPTVPLQDGEVKIGTQIWMTKNLNVSRYRNGDPIPQVTNPTQWANLTTGAWCYYNNDPANGRIYGKLYNWYAVNDPRGLAPLGYHVQSDIEWANLMTFLGGEGSAGGKLKAMTLWNSPNSEATNSSGFTAIPGGYRNTNGEFFYIGSYGFWWSSTLYDTIYASYWFIGSNSGDVNGGGSLMSEGFSVRCLRN